jgi:hypothetical protein
MARWIAGVVIDVELHLVVIDTASSVDVLDPHL